MTPEEIKKAKELCDKATPGEWTSEYDGAQARTHTIYSNRIRGWHGLNLFGRLEVDSNGKNNLDFVCGAKELLPKALEHIEALEIEMARLRKIEALYNKKQKPNNSPKM